MFLDFVRLSQSLIVPVAARLRVKHPLIRLELMSLNDLLPMAAPIGMDACWDAKKDTQK